MLLYSSSLASVLEERGCEYGVGASSCFNIIKCMLVGGGGPQQSLFGICCSLVSLAVDGP